MLKRAVGLAVLLGSFVFAGVLTSVAVVNAQGDPITWSLRSSAAGAVKPRDRFNAQINAQIDGGWHLYATTQIGGGPTPTRISLPAGQPFKLAGSIISPGPQAAFDENFGIETLYYEGSVTFTLPIAVTEDAKSGKHKLQVNVLFQTCNDRFCLPPTTEKLEIAIDITADPAKPESSETPGGSEAASSGNPQAKPSPSAAEPEPPTAAVESPTGLALPPDQNGASVVEPRKIATATVETNRSLLSFIWLAATVGALSLLTPCVFPMVPITVSYFTNHAAGGRAKAVRNATIYCGGIVLTFTALGMALALFVGAAGINLFAASPWVNLLITAIFIAFALNLFGAYQISVPSSLLTRLDAITRRDGSSQIVGLLLTGFIFTLTSFTCTAPFVGTLLVMAAQGEWQWPLLGMLTFSSVFALPFFALAVMPQFVAQLPKSGAWLGSVKVAMGFLEVAAAMKFISNVDLVWHWGIFTREVVLASWVAVMLLMTFYLLGKLQLSHESRIERVGALRLLTATTCLALCFYLLTGLFGKRLGEIESFLPPATETAGELSWMTNDYEGALAKARQESKLVLIDFTGYTCTNCRWMEANMFPRDEVKRELEKFVRVRLYTDGEGEVYKRHQKLEQEKFGTVALPYYAVVDHNGNPVAAFPGLTRNPDEFIAFLRTPDLYFAPAMSTVVQ